MAFAVLALFAGGAGGGRRPGGLRRRCRRAAPAAHRRAVAPAARRSGAAPRPAFRRLTAIVVDRIEALDGLFARWLPAAMLAIAGPALVALGRCCSPTRGRLVLLLCGLLVPVAMALPASAPPPPRASQFLALARLQARFLDRVRGIATIVLYGRAEDEARALAAAADELRRRTMRVLRVAFLSSAALDLAAALALVVLALRYGMALLAGRLTHPATALFVLLLVPEFFAPLRGFRRRLPGPAACHRRRRGAGRPAAAAGAAAAARSPHRRGARRHRGVRGRAPDLGSARAARRWTGCRSACRPARRWCWPARPAPASPR